MQAQEIIRRLSKATKDRRPLVQQLVDHEDVGQVVLALASNPASLLVRQILCDILGYKKDKQGVSVLVSALHDPDEGVRSSAADALAKIGDTSAGLPLFEQYQREPADSPVRSMILAALGAVAYIPAIPVLMTALDSSSEAERACAAWSLGALHAHEAQAALTDALAKEPPNDWAAANMHEALKQIAVSFP